MDTPRRPLGHWVKEIDRRIEADFGRRLAADGLTRRGWQVLNTIAAAPVTTAELDERLAPFLSSDEPTVRSHADALAVRGWADRTGATWNLTAAGRTAHERVTARVQAARQQLLDGVSPEEYGTFLAVLERIATNLAEAA